MTSGIERKITAFGETKSMTKWSQDPRCCVGLTVLRYRLNNWNNNEMSLTCKPHKKILEGVNKSYGWLQVLEVIKKDSKPIAKCLCSCGKEKNIPLYSLRSGKTTSCGCSRYKPMTEKLNGSNHPNTREPIYNRWAKIRERNKKYKATTESLEWDNFAIFKRWTEESEYTEKHRIMRRNTRKAFSPENCYLKK